MSEQTVDTRRRIVAILFSDIVGFTAAMGEDEDLAIRAVSRSRAIQKELVRKFNGQWVQEVGDGALCTFDSAVEAVNCALEIQRVYKDNPDCQLRIGIHVGDLVFRKTDLGHDIFGDGVNVASRVQGWAEPGGIAVSERVFDDLRNHKTISFRSMGEKRLKNVNRPIVVYAVLDRPPTAKETAKLRATRPKPRRNLVPWIAGAAAAVLLAVLISVLLRDSRKVTIRLGGEAVEPAVAARPPGAAGRADAAFRETRKALLGAAGPWREADARVWTSPDPVPNQNTYQVFFEASCDCQALLFAVDGSTDEISLIYPNPYEPFTRLVPGEARSIPSSPAYDLRAVGGQGMDILKLFVTSGDFAFPGGTEEAWGATPDGPERVPELASFLKSLDGTQWTSAATPLQITQ